MEKGNDLNNPGTDYPQPQQTPVGATQQPYNEGASQPLTLPQQNNRLLIPSLVGLVLISLGFAGYFAYQNYQIKQQATLMQTQPTPTSALPTNAPTPTSAVPTASPTTKTLNWQTYSNATAGFSISYPSGWRKVDTTNWIGFGPQEIGEDVVWGTSYYSKSVKTVAQIKEEVGKQFPDRKQAEETISFAGITATKVVTTTNQFADWYSVTIIVDNGNMLYAIGNGAQTDEALNVMIAKRTGKPSNLSFEDFYTSFKLTK